MTNNLNEKKSTKGIWLVTTIGVALLITISIIADLGFKNEQKKHIAIMKEQTRTFTETLAERDSIINEWMLTFNKIENDINKIKEKENIILVKSSNGIELSQDKKQQIFNDIQYLGTLLEESKKKLNFLSAQLKNSNNIIKSLDDKIIELNYTIKQQETITKNLLVALTQKNTEIEQLNTHVTEQQKTIVQKDNEINSQIAELNKGFIACGTIKELKAKNIISKKGEFLGIEIKKTLNNDLSDSSFTQVDVTKLKNVPVNSKNVKFITSHPKNSYEIIKDKNNRIINIEIKDYAQFWKISKYAILEIK